MKIFSSICSAIFALVIPVAAQPCTTASGATVPDGPVSAAANFTVSDGSILVTLTNQLADPHSAGQLLSGLSFTLASGATTGTLSTSSADVRTVSRSRQFTDQGPSATGWALDDSNGFLLCALCNDLGATGPKRLLIGDPNADTGIYSSANASIAGNKPHNPFTAGTATFLILAPGVSAGQKVTNATFFFGTAGGASGVPGVGVAVTGSCHGFVVG